MGVAALAAACVSPVALHAQSGAVSNGRARSIAAPRSAAAQKRAKPSEVPCGDPVGFQVLLDRAAFSPGQIDGHIGNNATRALSAFQALHNLPMTREPDCDTWAALGGNSGDPPVVTYEVTSEDLKGPFTRSIPRSLEAQATLPVMAYRSPIDRLSEEFHVSPGLLERMNPGMSLRAGAVIQVPAVTPFDPDARPPLDAALPDITIVVSSDESSLRAIGDDDTLLFFAPVSSGSVHDPLPAGDWQVKSVDWRPFFHYNPKLFWDANPADSGATINPGPRNPVGIVWIGLDLEHYGLHGTPNPDRIGYTQSHGCVRLTNWDAARVAALVRPGTPVLFR